MSTTKSATRKTTRFPFPTTTPEAYKAMSKEQKRDFNRKVREASAAFDANIKKQRDAHNEKFMLGLAALVAQFPHIEGEIVGNWLDRKGYMVVNDPEAKVRTAPTRKPARASKR